MISIDFPFHHLRRALAATFVALALFGIQSVAVAQTEIDITGGRVDPLPIAIAPFLAGGGAEESAATISAVVTNDLGRSGYFAPIDPATFIEQIASFDQTPSFASWNVCGCTSKSMWTSEITPRGRNATPMVSS